MSIQNSVTKFAVIQYFVVLPIFCQSSLEITGIPAVFQDKFYSVLGLLQFFLSLCLLLFVITLSHNCYSFFYLLWYWGLNSRPCTW
jgi:hypothetical protein